MQMSSRESQRAQSWVPCFSWPILTTCQAQSDARLFADDSLLYRTVNGVKDNTLLQEGIAALEERERL